MSLTDISQSDAAKLFPKLKNEIDEEIEKINRLESVNDQELDALRIKYEHTDRADYDRMTIAMYNAQVRRQIREKKIPSFAYHTLDDYKRITPLDHGKFTRQELNWCVAQNFIRNAQCPRSKEETLEYENEKQMNLAMRNKKFSKFRMDRYSNSHLYFEVLEEGAGLQKDLNSDAGYDILQVRDLEIPAGAKMTFASGVSVRIPKHYVGRIEQRSSAAKLLTLMVCGGIIDSGYRGEVRIVVYNFGKESCLLKMGERIFQIVVYKCYDRTPQAVEEGVLYDLSQNRGFR